MTRDSKKLDEYRERYKKKQTPQDIRNTRKLARKKYANMSSIQKEKYLAHTRYMRKTGLWNSRNADIKCKSTHNDNGTLLVCCRTDINHEKRGLLHRKGKVCW